MDKSPAAYMDPNSPPFNFDFNDPLFQYTNTGAYGSLPMSRTRIFLAIFLPDAI